MSTAVDSPRIVVALVTGEGRETDLDAYGSYACPWCASVVVSPEGWAANEAANAAHYAERGESYDSRDYPRYMADAYERHSCCNPACVVGLSGDQFQRARERRAEVEREAQRQRERAERWRRNVEESQRRDEETWAAARAEAEQRGACLGCLAASDWRSFRSEYPELRKRVRFVRHRGECPRERERRWRREQEAARRRRA
jgi:hypothetical protein